MEFRIDVVVNPTRAITGTKAVNRALITTQARANATHTALRRAFLFLGGAAVIRNALSTLTKFEQSMSTVAGVTKATVAEMAAFREEAQRLGITTRFTAVQAGDALVRLSRAGFTASEAIAALPQVLNLAQSAGVGLAEAASITASTLRAFGIEATKAEGVVDVLTVTANSANTNITELGEALKFASPAAAGLGVDLEDVNAALALLADRGLRGTISGTALRRGMLRLEAPTSAAVKRLNALGLTIKDVSVLTRGFIPVLETLAAKNVGVAEASRLLGVRAGPAFSILLSNLDELKRRSGALRDVAGAADVLARIMDDNLNGALIRAKSAYDGFILALGQTGGTAGLRGFFEDLANVLRFLAANADTVGRNMLFLATVLGVSLAKKAIGFLIKRLAALRIAILTNPIALLGIIVTGSIAALVAFGDQIKVNEDSFATLQDVAVVAWEKIKIAFSEAADFIEQVGKAVFGEGFQLNFQTLAEGAASTVDFMVGVFNGAFAAVLTIWDNLPQSFDTLWQLVKKGARDLAEFMIDFFLATLQTVGQLITNTGDLVRQVVANAAAVLGALSSGNLEAAQTIADAGKNAARLLLLQFTTIPGKLKANLAKLRGVELLPTVKLTEDAKELGDKVGKSFIDAFKETTSASDLVGDIFDEAERRAKDRADKAAVNARKEAEARAKLDAATKAAAGSGPTTEPGDPGQPIVDPALARAIALDAQLAKIEASRKAGQLGWLEYGRALETVGNKGAKGLTGLQKALATLVVAIDQVADAFANRATDALVEFVETGKFNFKSFAEAVLKDITRIIIRLLVVKALESAGIGGAAASGAGAAAGRRHGGTVQPDREFVVGENGPELFRPNTTGTIVPNAADARQPAPIVNVQNVTVASADLVPEAIANGSADKVIMNRISANRDKINRALRG